MMNRHEWGESGINETFVQAVRAYGLRWRMRKKIRDYLTKFVIFVVVFMTTSNMISMFFKNATTSEWILTIVISLIAAYKNLD